MKDAGISGPFVLNVFGKLSLQQLDFNSSSQKKIPWNFPCFKMEVEVELTSYNMATVRWAVAWSSTG